MLRGWGQDRRQQKLRMFPSSVYNGVVIANSSCVLVTVSLWYIIYNAI